ncbi:MAG: hypothetical protein ACRD3E_11850 [Terriglobales bacterium]
MYVLRAEHSHSVEEVLERILEHGMVLDGLSHLAALGSTPGISASTSPERARVEPPRDCPIPVPPRPGKRT